MANTTTGQKNSAYGYKTMWKNQSGNNNAGYGYETMQENTGSNNDAFGKETLADSVNNNNCVAIGYKAGYGVHSSLLGTNETTKSYKNEDVPNDPTNQIITGANALSHANNTNVLGNKDIKKTIAYCNEFTFTNGGSTVSLDIVELI